MGSGRCAFAHSAHLAGGVLALQRRQVDHRDRQVERLCLGGRLDGARRQRGGARLTTHLVDTGEPAEEAAQRRRGGDDLLDVWRGENRCCHARSLAPAEAAKAFAFAVPDRRPGGVRSPTTVRFVANQAGAAAGPVIETFAPLSGRVLGYVAVGAGLLLALASVSDPIANQGTILFGVILCLIAWVVLIRPLVVAHTNGVVLHNMVSDTFIPWSSIEKALVLQTLRVVTPTKVYHGLGVSRSARSIVRESRPGHATPGFFGMGGSGALGRSDSETPRSTRTPAAPTRRTSSRGSTSWPQPAGRLAERLLDAADGVLGGAAAGGSCGSCPLCRPAAPLSHSTVRPAAVATSRRIAASRSAAIRRAAASPPAPTGTTASR